MNKKKLKEIFTKERIKNIAGQLAFCAFAIGVFFFIRSSTKSDNKTISFMEKYENQSDSLFMMHIEYRKMIDESNQRIQELSRQNQEIINQQPKIYNRYVTKYITNLNPADTSAFNEVYEKSINEFDALWNAGFFVTK